MVSRLVYYAFIGPIDFDKDALCITHKDGDSLNNHFSNLEAKTKGEVTEKSYRLKRRTTTPLAAKTKKEMKEIRKKAALSTRKKVIQYSLEGKRLHIFESVKEATRHSGITNIVPALKGRMFTSGGFIWRYAPSPKKISAKQILKRKADGFANQRRAVQQYSPAGKLLKTYKSIIEASTKTNIPRTTISGCLARRLKMAGKYKWQYA
jgi:hypothetical protein